MVFVGVSLSLIYDTGRIVWRSFSLLDSSDFCEFKTIWPFCFGAFEPWKVDTPYIRIYIYICIHILKMRLRIKHVYCILMYICFFREIQTDCFLRFSTFCRVVTITPSKKVDLMLAHCSLATHPSSCLLLFSYLKCINAYDLCFFRWF